MSMIDPMRESAAAGTEARVGVVDVAQSTTRAV